MRDYSTPDWIRLIVSIHFACMRRREVRSFSGYALGKRREPSRFPGLASGIAETLFQSLEFYEDGETLQRPAIAPVILEALQRVTAEDAFALASRNNDLVRLTRDVISQGIADALVGAFDVRKKTRPEYDVIRPKPKHGSAANDALAHLERMGQLVPRYTWRRANGPYLADFFGSDREVTFGRIWQDASFDYDEQWQWTCLVSMKRILNSPPEGRTDIARQAARDVEDYYDALKRLNGTSE
ncbi:hypothetical protein GR212_15235 [Rhizobium lusitanum]|uniref:Uncharacterized protein n=1 Tax=Rhizobium lusitanum TaxID=293958 RepID=A0A6L9U9G3_9HYPH|nr:hypothetical protein [Rhizobium lusitanum]NEI70936.1 hypothetical protein [Rhizobium lusitanum]